MNPLLAAESISASMPERILSTHLQVHAPLRLVGDDWSSPLSWSPSWFRPYAHQAAAFERLTTSKSFARPTLLVADKGAGSTEAYLYPILDHCLRQKRSSRPGMKALVVCRTAGTAREHAKRTATVIGWDPALNGISVGCHPGASGSGGSAIAVGEVTVPVDPAALGAAPPDIVFTTASALGTFMVDPGFEGLWAATTRESLRYVVVEDVEGHGAAALGELALGLRRIGAKLHMQSSVGGPPLGGAAVVATISAPALDAELLDQVAELGSRLFGVAMGLDSIVVESRHTAGELASSVDRSALVPAPADLAGIDPSDVAAIAAALGLAELADDPVALGSRLGVHPLTAAIMAAASERPADIRTVLDVIGQWAPSWQADPADERAQTVAVAALARLLGLLTAARRQVGSVHRPLVAVDVHLWLAATTGEPRPAVLAGLLPPLWAGGRSSGPDRRTLVLTASLQEASHGAALVRSAVPPAAAGPDAPSVIARDVTAVTAAQARAAVDGAFDDAHPEAPLVLLTPHGSDVGVDEGTASTLVLLGSPTDAAEYRSRIGNLGRDAGSSLTITVVGSDGRDRAIGSDASAVVAGVARLPDLVVEDPRLLSRYYLAEAADSLLSSGRRGVSASVTIEQAVRDGFDPEAVLGALLDAASDPERSSSFVGSLGIGGLGSSSPGSSTDLAAGGRPGTLFGRPIAEGGGAGSIARPEPPPASEPSPLPPLAAGPPSDLPLLGTGTEQSAALIDSSEVLDAVRSFAATGVEPLLREAVTGWRDRTMVLRSRLRRTAALTRAAAAGQSPVDAAALSREAPIVSDAVRSRRVQPWPAALAELGVLPDLSGADAIRSEAAGAGGTDLDVALWPNEQGGPQVRFLHRFSHDHAGSGGWPSTVIVPGSTVFAEAHRVLVDGLDLDSEGGAADRGAAAGADRREVQLDRVVAQGPEELARDDGSPTVESPRVVVAIGADEPEPAWCLSAAPFGAQLLRSVTLRASFGSRNVCEICGVVQGVRPIDAADPQSVHRLWCEGRTNASHQVWAPVDLTSEQQAGTALRVLLPVARLDVDRRVAGFEAAILAGIAQTGRSVHDLHAVHAPAQDADGAVRQSLVLCSNTAAGAAVLAWLADPGHLRETLDAGWQSGAPGAVASMIEDLIRTGGQPGRVDSLDAVDVASVERRELGEALVDALTSWATSDDHAELLPGQDGAAFTLVVTLEENRHAYRVEVVQAPSGPRVVIRTTTSKLPPLVVVPVIGDADEPDEGGLVWQVSWSDVSEFRSGLRPGTSFEVAGVSLLSDQARLAADARQRADGGVFDVVALEQNPLALLLDVLARPSVAEWRRVAGVAVAAAADAGSPSGGPGSSAWSNITRLARL